MNLDEIVADIVIRTSRPDREDVIRRATRSAITEVHASALYPRDRVEEIFPLAAETNLVKLVLPPRFRKFEVLAAVTADGIPVCLNNKSNTYERVDPAGLFDSTLGNKTDIYYVAGAAFNIKSSVKVTNIYALYFRRPEVADNNLETWIMAEHESLISDLVMSKVQGSFGREKLAQDAFNKWSFSMQNFVFDNIVEGAN